MSKLESSQTSGATDAWEAWREWSAQPVPVYPTPDDLARRETARREAQAEAWHEALVNAAWTLVALLMVAAMLWADAQGLVTAR